MTKPHRAAALAASLALLAACAGPDHEHGGRRVVVRDTPDRAEANKAVVRAFYDLAFNQKQPEEAVKRYVGRTYRQHNPMAGDGPEPFIAFVRAFTSANPGLRVDFKRFIADGDLVVVHSHMTTGPGDRGTAVVDIFRLEDGKVVEHWDVIQPVPEKAANGNTMF